MKSIQTTALAVLLAGIASATTTGDAPGAGEAGGDGLAILCAKALVCPPDPKAAQVVDNAVVLIRDGKIEGVERRRGYEIPDGYEVLDVGDNWVMPGLVGLHSHVAGTFDINDMVYLTNPGLRANTSVRPHNPSLKMAVAGGVTSILFIPGSGTNIGGQGVLLKTGHDNYEDALIRGRHVPGSIKLAQYGNPESWAMGVRAGFENWNTRNTFRRGLAYARRWAEYEASGGTEPELNLQWEPFRPLLKGETVVSTHTQIYQVVLMTLTMIAGEFDVPVFLDHSTIGGWRAGEMTAEMGVAAICGPRSIDPVTRGMSNWAHHGYEGVRGVAVGYQERGVELVGFNTDAPVLPQEELALQAAMGCRYGFKDEGMQAVRGLTIVPAITARIDDEVGSLQPGRDADVLVVNGHIADPRTSVELVLIDGKQVYENGERTRRW
jgi:imidazolonepropionase-like amidohydrolase